MIAMSPTRCRGHLFAGGCLAAAGFLAAASIAPAAAQEVDRSRPPEIGPPPTVELPPIQRFELGNGLPVVLLEKHQVPLVQLQLLVRAGSAQDPPERRGLASMVGAMLDEGAGGRSALELADAVDFLGASLGVSADVHATTVSLFTPLSKLEAALPLMADVALRPDFTAEELERQRAQRLTTLTQWRDEPRMLAQIAFSRALFGDEHPYGRLSFGTVEGLRAITAGDLRSFHGTWYDPCRSTLVVVGDVTADGIRPALEAAFGAGGDWAGCAERPSESWPEAERVRELEVFLLDRPGAAQSEVRIGRVGPARSTEDYYALQVMNTVLGGSFTSRLNQSLREEHGWSYGAYSYFAFDLEPGPFLAGAAVQTAVTDSALSEFMAQLRGIVEGITAEELERAKSYVALRFPQRFETVRGVAFQLGDLVLHDLPDRYLNEYVPNILAVTKADVERVARAYIDPERMAVVVVGDRERIEAGVRALELGPLRLMTVEDVLGPPPTGGEGDGSGDG